MTSEEYLDQLFQGLGRKQEQAGITASEDSLYEASMGMENPLVALGSDPMRTFFGPYAFVSDDPDTSPVVGRYRPEQDQTYVALPDIDGKIMGMEDAKDTYKHESVHRAIRKLLDEYSNIPGGEDLARPTFQELIISQILGGQGAGEMVPNELIQTLYRLAGKKLGPEYQPIPEVQKAPEEPEVLGPVGAWWDDLDLLGETKKNWEGMLQNMKASLNADY
jgi:hypothetical protein